MLKTRASESSQESQLDILETIFLRPILRKVNTIDAVLFTVHSEGPRAGEIPFSIHFSNSANQHHFAKTVKLR